MKKVVALFATVLIFSFAVLPVSASDTKKPKESDISYVLGENAEYITDGEMVFLPMEFDKEILFDDIETHKLAVKQTEYEGSIAFSDGKNILLRAKIRTDNGSYYKYYVAESALDMFSALHDGRTDNYCASNAYSDYVYMTADEYSSVFDGTYLTVIANMLDDYESFPLYATDKSGAYKYEIGLFFRNYSSIDEIYMLLYAEYDRSYFYRGGEFATDHSGEVNIYKLEDAVLIEKLNDCFNTLPADELEWVAKENDDIISLALLATVFFAVIPLDIIIISLIMLAKRKNRRYRMPIFAIMGGAAAVIIAYTAVFIMLAVGA